MEAIASRLEAITSRLEAVARFHVVELKESVVPLLEAREAEKSCEERTPHKAVPQNLLDA